MHSVRNKPFTLSVVMMKVAAPSRRDISHLGEKFGETGAGKIFIKSAAENEQGEPARQGPQDRPLGHPGETGPDGGGRAGEPAHRGRHLPPQDFDEKDPGGGDLPEGNHVRHAQCSGEDQGALTNLLVTIVLMKRVLVTNGNTTNAVMTVAPMIHILIEMF